MANKQNATSHWKDERSHDKYFALNRALRAEAWDDLETSGRGMPLEQDVSGTFGTTRVFRWPGNGVPVVMIHGAQTDAFMWSPLIAELDTALALYAPSTLGDPGESIQTKPIMDVARLVDWLDETLDALNLDRVHLVGCSYGGWLALHYASGRPARVGSLTLIEPVVDKLRPKFFIHGISAGFAMAIPGPQRRRFGRRFDVEFLATNPRQRTLGSMAFTKHRRTGLPRFTPIDDDVIRDLTVPTLAMLGERSPIHHFARDLAKKIKRLNPSVTVEVVRRAGHTLAVEHPTTVASLLEPFLERRDCRSEG